MSIDVCGPSGHIHRHIVSKAQVCYMPSLYTAMRKSSWGGLFPALSTSNITTSPTTAIEDENEMEEGREAMRKRERDSRRERGGYGV